MVAAHRAVIAIVRPVPERAPDAESHRPLGPVALQRSRWVLEGYACVPGCVPIGGAVAGVTLLPQSSPGS
jgi:hypothetical protein